MPHFDEPTIKSESVFTGNLINVQVDTVQLPNGKTATRELVKHPGAVAILAITDDNRLVVVEQYRKPLERITTEIPAGKLEPAEDLMTCAKRELVEETGYTADTWTHLVSFYTSPGFADEQLHLFIAEDLQAGSARPDEDEFVTMKAITLDEAWDLMQSGHICDAKTVTAVYAWQHRLLNNR